PLSIASAADATVTLGRSSLLTGNDTRPRACVNGQKCPLSCLFEVALPILTARAGGPGEAGGTETAGTLSSGGRRASYGPGKLGSVSGRARRVLRVLSAASLIAGLAGVATALGPSGTTAAATSLNVYVGYADTHHSATPALPSPWMGSPGVTFVGDAGNWDGGAVRVDNSDAIAYSAHIWYTEGTDSYDCWGTVTIPASSTLVLGPKTTTACPYENDTSDLGPNPARGVCTPVTVQPVVRVVISGVETDYTDSGQILNTGGVDAVACPPPGPNDESHRWVLISGLSPTPTPTPMPTPTPTPTPTQPQHAPRPHTARLRSPTLAGSQAQPRIKRTAAPPCRSARPGLAQGTRSLFPCS